MQLTLEFRVPDNAFHAGDTSTIQLPAGFVFYSDSTFDVTSSTGVTVAHATVTRDASTMTMTYTDYVDDHSNITGSLHFTFKMDPNNEPAQGDHPFDLLVDNKPVDWIAFQMLVSASSPASVGFDYMLMPRTRARCG